jgi:hypothetical protein
VPTGCGVSKLFLAIWLRSLQMAFLLAVVFGEAVLLSARSVHCQSKAIARVVELVDTQVSEACVERHGSSSLPSGTIDGQRLTTSREFRFLVFYGSFLHHLKDFDEPYTVDGEARRWSKIWNFLPNPSNYTHFIQAPHGSKMYGDPLSEVGCPYVVRGFDFDYVGLLWLSDLRWRGHRWAIDTEHVFESGVKRLTSAARNEVEQEGPAHLALLRATQEAYRILLTRPLKGLYIWCEDPETKMHLEASLNMT